MAWGRPRLLLGPEPVAVMMLCGESSGDHRGSGLWEWDSGPRAFLSARGPRTAGLPHIPLGQISPRPLTPRLRPAQQSCVSLAGPAEPPLSFATWACGGAGSPTWGFESMTVAPPAFVPTLTPALRAQRLHREADGDEPPRPGGISDPRLWSGHPCDASRALPSCLRQVDLVSEPCP